VVTEQARGEATATHAGGSRVLILVENVPAAIDTRLRKQIDSLLGAGYAVSVISRRDPANEAYRNHPQMRMYEYRAPREPSGALGYPVEYGMSFMAAAWLTLRACLHGGIDVVQVCQPPDIYFPIAMVLRLFGYGVLIDQRDLMPELYMARYGSSARGAMLRMLRRLERISYHSARQYLCVNDYLMERALASGVPAEHVTIVRNGPSIRRAERATPDPALKRGRPFLCCWAGKMGRQDRLDLLLEAVRHYVHELGRDDCHVAILGDGECLEETKAAVEAVGLGQHVSFPGWLSEKDLFGYLATADLGLDASLQEEVSPVKAMEYMACGLAFVSFDLEQTRAVAEGAASFAPRGDAEALARLMDELLHDPGRREAMGRIGRDRVAGDLAWELQAVHYLEAVSRARPESRRASRALRRRDRGRTVRT
jgi:glycosyltransferase involved in cell wall biosynthesis